MKNVNKLLSLVLTVCMVLSLLPATAQAGMAPYTISTGTVYSTLSETLANAPDGAIITLSANITESVTYAVYAGKTITIDGGGHTLTGTAATNAALALSGAGTVILKNLTLQSGASIGISKGLDVSGSVSVQSYGTVTANGSAATATSSYGVTNSGTGTVDVTEAIAAGMMLGFGAYNTGSGTINVGSATGSGAMNGVGAYNNAGGTINVTTASGNRTGVTNFSSGTVNVTTAINTDTNDPFGCGVKNEGTGTVNAIAVTGNTGVNNISMGMVNAGTITGKTTNSGGGTVNTGAAVTSVPLHAGTGASCVLSSITIANSGSTIGTLPDVYKGSQCSADWYTGVALTNRFTMQEISPEATLYSSFYTIETAKDLADYITQLSTLTASVSGSTVTVTGAATLFSTTSDAALAFEIPAGVTVVWKAALSGGGSKYLLEPTGDGTFEVADGANIVNTACQTAIYCYDGKGQLIITGGKVSSTGAGMAIGIAGDWLLTMTGGEVAANADDSCAIFGKNPVVITGGMVSATGTGGFQLYMSETSVYRGGVLNTGKIMYHTSGVFAEVCVGTAVTQAVYGTSTGLTVTGHNLPAGDSMSAVWAKQNGESGVNISYYSARDTTVAAKKWFLVVPGVNITMSPPIVLHAVTASANPAEGGKVTGSGIYPEGASVTVTASVYSGYSFVNWTESGSEISKSLSYTFTVGTANKTLVANFAAISPTTPTITNAEKVAADKAALTIGYAAGDSASSVTQNLGLTVTGAVYGSTISWASNNTALISNSGTVTRPTYSNGDTAVTVTATVYNAGASDTKSFNLVVLKLPKTTSGGSSYSGGGAYSNTTTTITVAINTEASLPSVTSTIAAEVKSDSNGKAVATVTESQIKDAVNKAVEAAAKQGEGTAAKIEIKVTSPADAKAIETVIPKPAITAVAESKANELAVTTPVATISFSKGAINTISKETASDIKLTASKVDTASLSAEAKAVIGDRPVFNFSVTSGDKTISKFDGTVTLSIPYTPKAGEDINAIVIYYINAEGKPEIVRSCVYNPATGTITFTTSHFSIYAVGYNKVSFKDVAADAWYGSAVTFVAARGITTGTGEGNYSPEDKLTRGQFLVMVMRAYGIKADENAKDNFADSGSTYYTGYLAAAKRLGISEGTGNNMFAPEKEITRQEMFTLLYNTLKSIGELPVSKAEKDLSAFSDANSIDSWAKDAMTLFVKAGAVSGSNGKLSPTDTTTRAEMAQVLYNLLSK